MRGDAVGKGGARGRGARRGRGSGAPDARGGSRWAPRRMRQHRRACWRAVRRAWGLLPGGASRRLAVGSSSEWSPRRPRAAWGRTPGGTRVRASGEKSEPPGRAGYPSFLGQAPCLGDSGFSDLGQNSPVPETGIPGREQPPGRKTTPATLEGDGCSGQARAVT